MTSELVWGGAGQIELLWNSTLVGLVLGVLFDILNGFGRIKSKTKRFVEDVLFCCFAAVVTFFASLVFNNGILHPVLLLGIFLGVFAEHIILGTRVSKSVYVLSRLLAFIINRCLNIFDTFFQKIRLALMKICKIGKRKTKKTEKIRKISRFFQKNT